MNLPRNWELPTRTSGPGAARLSSARVVRCPLNWVNERNPYPVLNLSQETASGYGEEGGDDVKSAWPSDALGYTRATMANTMGCQRASGS